MAPLLFRSALQKPGPAGAVELSMLINAWASLPLRTPSALASPARTGATVSAAAALLALPQVFVTTQRMLKTPVRPRTPMETLGELGGVANADPPPASAPGS